MRTTLDIDDDLLRAIQEMARRQRSSAGKVASALIRQALLGPAATAGMVLSEAVVPPAASGFRPFTHGKRLVTNDEVNQLREVEGI